MFFSKDQEDKENKDNDVSNIKSGDFIIEFDDLISKTDEGRQEGILKLFGHGMVYSTGGSDPKVIHATLWDKMKIKEVCEGPLLKMASPKSPLGTTLILRFKDEKLCKLIHQEAFKVSKDARTVFEYFSNRRRDFNKELKKGQKTLPKARIEDVSKLEFFRAFRAYHRIQNKEPISKKKGISCGNFLSYIYKTAAIHSLFPEGLPAKIITQLEVIENLRKGSDAGKKLDKVDMKEINKFEQMVLEHLSESSVSVSEKNKANFIKELYRPIKATTVNEFAVSALKTPEMWDAGIMFYDTDNDQQPAFMPFQKYALMPDDSANTLGSKAIREKEELIVKKKTI